jgi:hypothetical protein
MSRAMDGWAVPASSMRQRHRLGIAPCVVRVATPPTGTLTFNIAYNTVLVKARLAT